MLLSRNDYVERLTQGRLKLAFVGMSNIGKSFASQALAKMYNLKVYDNDAAIAQSLGLADMQGLSDWMHYPDHKLHRARAEEYINVESNLIAQALTCDQGAIFDLTGSAIYCDPNDLAALKNNALIVHISALESDLNRLEKLFFDNPKPLIWRDQFNVKAGENAPGAMLRCYPHLLSTRKKAYEALTDISIAAQDFRDLSGDAMATLIGRSLPAD